MEQIGRLTFVPLLGEPPPGIDLDPLPSPEAVRSIVEESFSEFFSGSAEVETIDGKSHPTPSADGIHLIYAYGHAWRTPQGPRSASEASGVTVVETGFELLSRLLLPGEADRTVLILDTCYAAAFDQSFVSPIVPPRLTVYSSVAGERAIALNTDRSSRLSLAFARDLSGRSAHVDLVRVVINVADKLDEDGLIPGQQVTYRMNGPGLQLTRGSPRQTRRRERTVALIRNALLTAGALGAVGLIALAWFYWSHVLIEVNLGGLTSIASGLRIMGTEENPGANGSQVLIDRDITGDHVRFWAKAGDLILRIKARYNDGADRGLSWHLDLKPGFDPQSKSFNLELPPASEVVAHPGMAQVPETTWYHGREREPRRNSKPYWIDLRPPTVDEYRLIARALQRAGRLLPENSFLLNAEVRSSAVDAVGLGQLRDLNKNLGSIFGIIDQASSSTVSAPSDIVVGLNQLPCPTCPAPMTRHEAELYCASQKKRLPTDLEWELAVRGVDGRVYPWGNQFDDKRANVPGLPDKGQPPPSLKPVDAYKTELSPFGLIDTIGNAGDWVENETGSYDRVYMGATYRFNPEDATAFRMLPITDSDALVREVTARCVATALLGQ